MPAVIALSCAGSDAITGPRRAARPALDAAAAASTGGVVISQVYGGGGNSGATYTNDFIELHNTGDVDVPLDGWSVQYASKSGTTWQVTALSGFIEAGGYYLVQEAKGNGGSVALPAPNATGSIPMSGSDGKVALANTATALDGSCPTGDPAVVDFVGYGGANCFEGSKGTKALTNTTAAIRLHNGDQDTNDNAADFTTGAPIPRSGAWSGGDGDPATGGMKLSPGAASPLVIGYQSPFYISGKDAQGNAFDYSTITWTSSDPSVLSVDSRGIATAADSGSATITATAPDGSSASFTMATEVPFYSKTARRGHNTELGVPTDADPSNDVIIARDQYTVSYNPQRGGANWVSWDLSASHLGSRNRCNCYSADTALARLGYGQYMYTTLDWTSGGQYDRGHMAPSADFTTTDGENATSFFLTNFLPQKHGLNAGPWEALENALRDSVRAGREAYVIAGGIFTNGVGLGTLNNAGKIAIPDSTWKIVVLMPAGGVLGDITSPSDVDVIAVNMPNVDSPGTNDWTAFTTTVEKIQRSTGYDFLAALPDLIECRVEQRNCVPEVARFSGATILAGETYTATGSFDDPDPDMWTASANYGDGTGLQSLELNGQSLQLSHQYASAGTFTVQLSVRDNHGAIGTGSATVTVQSAAQGVSNLSDMLSTLGLGGMTAMVRTAAAASPLNAGQLNSLQAKLDAAAAQLQRGNGDAAANQLGAFVNELQAMVSSNRVGEGSAAPIIAYAQRVITSARR